MAMSYSDTFYINSDDKAFELAEKENISFEAAMDRLKDEELDRLFEIVQSPPNTTQN